MRTTRELWRIGILSLALGLAGCGSQVPGAAMGGDARPLSESRLQEYAVQNYGGQHRRPYTKRGPQCRGGGYLNPAYQPWRVVEENAVAFRLRDHRIWYPKCVGRY